MVRILSNKQLAKQLVDFCTTPNLKIHQMDRSSIKQSSVSPYHFFEKEGRCLKPYAIRKKRDVARNKNQCPPEHWKEYQHLRTFNEPAKIYCQQRECPICFDSFDLNHMYKIPWACRSCNHAFCTECFTTMMKNHRMRKYFTCPLCRNKCQSPYLVQPTDFTFGYVWKPIDRMTENDQLLDPQLSKAIRSKMRVKFTSEGKVYHLRHEDLAQFYDKISLNSILIDRRIGSSTYLKPTETRCSVGTAGLS